MFVYSHRLKGLTTQSLTKLNVHHFQHSCHPYSSMQKKMMITSDDCDHHLQYVYNRFSIRNMVVLVLGIFLVKCHHNWSLGLNPTFLHPITSNLSCSAPFPVSSEQWPLVNGLHLCSAFLQHVPHFHALRHQPACPQCPQCGPQCLAYGHFHRVSRSVTQTCCPTQ